jgi:microcystin-dependent protein
MTSILRRQGDLPATGRPTVGDLKMSMVNVDHIGWLKCDGRQVPIDAFRHLFEVVGYSFGTDVSAGYFRLPNPQGRVLGMIGQSAGTSDWSMGDVSGEEYHTLTIAELPAHNHDISGGALNTANGVDPAANGRTSLEATGIDVVPDGVHTHSITDPGHTHSLPLNSAALTGVGPSDDVTQGGGYNTGASTTGIIIDVSGLHDHAIVDPKHIHRIASNGGSLPHNNIQPTIWIGNLFVYGGRLFRDAPSGGNWFPHQGAPINVY